MVLAEEACKEVVEESDSEDDDSSVGRPLPPPVVGEEDLQPLETVAKRARSAGRNAAKVYRGGMYSHEIVSAWLIFGRSLVTTSILVFRTKFTALCVPH